MVIKTMTRIRSSSDLLSIKKTIISKRESAKTCITVCCGTGCTATGGVEVLAAFKEIISELNAAAKVETKMTGCHGFCERGPLVVIRPRNVFYQQVKPEDAKEIVTETVLEGKIIERLLYTDPATDKKITVEDEVPFYKYQSRILFGDNGSIDPTDINDYLAIDGYQALGKALQMRPEQIVDEVKKSGLRGRGGAGFPTGPKWQFCRQANPKSEPHDAGTTNGQDLKYIICNADEGDPGAFMDRSLLEGNPHSVIEGMIIGALAICGGTEYKPEGYIYIRNEYPLAIKHLEIAIQQAREYGLLGENILGSGFGFDIKISRGAGAFVCGEESALIASIEGRLGEARPRPPYPAEKGLFNQPTNINNVKTWASVRLVINNGADWFASIGTEKSKGTMIFSLVGKINNTGLVEVPMGMPLRELVYKIGGGIPDGKKLKAVQTGGPSGGCIPESMLDLPVDYEALTKAGSMMGSGGMIVMDENTCMVNVAKYFLNFTVHESCGKCTPCREGVERMHDILVKITEGKGDESDIPLLEELASAVANGALCALGGTAPNPVITTLRYFRDEYEAHIRDKKCPGGVCKALITYSIDAEKCTGCTVCSKKCPQDAIAGERKAAHVIDQPNCIKCGVCLDTCKFNAVKVQ